MKNTVKVIRQNCYCNENGRLENVDQGAEAVIRIP